MPHTELSNKYYMVISDVRPITGFGSICEGPFKSIVGKANNSYVHVFPKRWVTCTGRDASMGLSDGARKPWNVTIGELVPCSKLITILYGVDNV